MCSLLGTVIHTLLTQPYTAGGLILNGLAADNASEDAVIRFFFLSGAVWELTLGALRKLSQNCCFLNRIITQVFKESYPF